jgi:hypothetical protein
MLPTHTFIYFKEYRDNKQSLTSPSKGLEETVEASVTLLEGMMAGVAHMYSVGEKLQLPSRTPLILDGFSLLVVRFTTKR